MGGDGKFRDVYKIVSNYETGAWEPLLEAVKRVGVHSADHAPEFLGFLRRDLRAPLAGFGEADRDGLLPRGHLASFPTFAGSQLPFLFETHCALDTLARRLAISPRHRLLLSLRKFGLALGGFAFSNAGKEIG